MNGRAYPRYARYKDSGVEWLGEIPEHWPLLPLKRHLRVQSGDMISSDQEVVDGPVPIIGGNGVRGYTARSNTMGPALVIGRVGAKCGCVHLVPRKFWASEHCLVVHPSRPFNLQFGRYMLETIDFNRLAIRTAQPLINTTIVEGAFAAFPPRSEQEAIAAFLDRETARLDALIEKQEKMIERLEEKRKALISRAVSQGLNPDVRVKESGVEWLGRVPMHWDAIRLKYVAYVQAGVTLGKEYWSSDLAERPYLRVANVQDGYLDLDDVKTIRLPPDEAGRYELQRGDVLMTEGGDFDKLGRGCVWQGQVDGCLHQNHIFAVRPDGAILDSRFLAAVLESFVGKTYFTSTSQQTTNLACTNRTKLRAFMFGLPPIEEQRDIVGDLDRATGSLRSVRMRVRALIERLRERRTAVISAAVTGTIDVREAA